MARPEDDPLVKQWAANQRVDADKIDEAIAAAEPQIAMIRIPVQLSSTGRPAAVEVPADATDAELVDLAGWLLTALRAHIAQSQRPTGPRLLVPRRIANQ